MAIENNNQNSWRSNLGIIILVFGGILAIAGAVLVRRFFLDWRLVSAPVHSAFEFIGAVLGIIMAVLILTAWNRKKDIQKYLWVSSALFGMAIVDIFHASVIPGSLFVWLHSMAMLIGGFFFVLVWLPESLLKMKIPVLPILVIIGSVVFGFISVMYPDTIPLMAEKGRMTDIAKNINIVAGILFLAAGIRFMVSYMNNGNSEDVLFANFCLFSAIAALFFYVSFLWNADWWFWHVVRLWGFASTLGVLIVAKKDGVIEELIT